MMREAHMRIEPRAQVLIRHTRAVLRSTNLCERKLAARISDAYQAMVAPAERCVAFRTGTTVDQLDHAERMNAQLIGRFLRGDVKMPADLEEAWVVALPEPHRDACARELVRRHGFLGARHPTSVGTDGAVVGIADLAREFGETIQAVAPILALARIDADAAPLVQRARRECADLMAALVTLDTQLTAVLDAGRTP